MDLMAFLIGQPKTLAARPASLHHHFLLKFVFHSNRFSSEGSHFGGETLNKIMEPHAQEMPSRTGLGQFICLMVSRRQNNC